MSPARAAVRAAPPTAAADASRLTFPVIVRVLSVIGLLIVAYQAMVTPFGVGNVRVTCSASQPLARNATDALSEEGMRALRACVAPGGPFLMVLTREEVAWVRQRFGRVVSTAPSSSSSSSWWRWPRRRVVPLWPGVGDESVWRRVACIMDALHPLNDTGQLWTKQVHTASVWRIAYVQLTKPLTETYQVSLLSRETPAASPSPNNRTAASAAIAYASHENALLMLHVPSRHTAPTASYMPARLELFQNRRRRGLQPPDANVTADATIQLERNTHVLWRGDAWHRLADLPRLTSWVQAEYYLLDRKEWRHLFPFA